MAWFDIAKRQTVLEYNARLKGQKAPVDMDGLAREWASLLEEGQKRWPEFPWEQEGLSEYFLFVKVLNHWSFDKLWDNYGEQLDHARALQRRMKGAHLRLLRRLHEPPHRGEDRFSHLQPGHAPGQRPDRAGPAHGYGP